MVDLSDLFLVSHCDLLMNSSDLDWESFDFVKRHILILLVLRAMEYCIFLHPASDFDLESLVLKVYKNLGKTTYLQNDATYHYWPF